MAELGKISGQMLKSNLERLGVDLVFENQSGDNNLYLDVNALKIGINTDALSRELTINGDSLFDGLIVDNDAQLVNLYIDGDAGTITSYDSNLTILNNGQLYAPALETSNLRFANNYIQGLISNEDIELDANGLGRTIIPSDVTIEGNLSGVVDLSIVGDIVFGNDFETDTITFNAEISGNLIPSASDTYSLGTEESKWGLIRSRLVNGEFLVTDDLGLVPDLNPNVALRVGKSIFVGKNGSDTDDGYHQLAPFATLKHALSVAVAGDVITLYPGVYQEEFPLSVPVGVTVKGSGIRAVAIEPTVDTKDNDAFLLNGETTVSDLTVRNFLYNSTNDTGYGFRFDENFEVTTRSPYVQNITVITAPDGGLAGRGALVDGSSATLTSKEASMLFHSVTFIVPDAIGLYMTNGVRVEWLNSFTYFASKGLYATNGSTGRLSADGSTIVYGAELRSIASANVYGLVGAEGDGDSVLMYLINHNFGYIGTGTDATNDPSAVDQDSEVVTVNDARVYWQSDDHNGNFRVGEAFFVDQETGLVTFNSQGQSVGGINQLLFSNGVDLTVLNGNKVQTGNVIFENNQITTTTGDLNLDSFVDFPELADVAVTGNLTTTGNFNVDGQITFGNQTVDTVSFEADVDSDLLPKLSNESTLGSESRKWNSIWLGQASIGDIVINDNQITTLTSNSDLEISAAAGNNVSVTNLLLPNDFSSASAVNFLDTDIVGNVLLSGTSVLNGNTVVQGNFGTSSQLNLATDLLGFGNILFTGNAITTTDSNSDLELRANGTGQVLADIVDVSSDVNYGSINSSTIIVNETLESNSYTFGNFLLKDNFLEVAADIDLIFDPAGTGKTSLQSLASISNNLTVTDLTTLEDVTATGTYQLLGTFNRSSGVFDTLGDYDLTGEISSTTLQLGNISFSNNSISNTSINDLTVSADKIIFNPSLEILNDLVVDNDLTVGNYTAIDLELESLQTDDIQIFDNVITTTVSLSSLTLRAAGTGKVIVDDSLTVSLDTIVTGTSTLSTTDITGTVTLTGDIDQTNAVTNQRTGNTDLTGLLTAAELTVDDITIDNDEILATGDLELSAGVANDIIISSDVNITQNLAVDGSVIADNIVATEIILDSIGTGDILIDGDTVATTASNSNLEIAATTVTFNKDTVANSITVANLLDVQNTVLNGNLTTSGKTAVGDFNLDGTLNIIGDATSDGLVVDDIEISSSTVTTIASNADLELRANGAGDVVFQSSVSITNDLEILGNTAANSIYANTIIYDYFSNGTVRFDDNRISTTISNSDLELQAAGSGSVVVPSNNVQIDNDLKVNGTGGPANDGVYTSTTSGGEVAVQKDIFGNALLLTGEPSSATWQAVKTLEPGDLGIIILSGTSYPFTLTSWVDPSREEAVIDIPTLPNGIAAFDLTITLRPRFDGASLNNTSIVGTLTHFGDRNQSGGSYQVDNYELIGLLATDFRSQFGDLSIDGNQISNTVIDSDIILSAAGTGKVLVTADLIIGEDLSVGGNISSTELSITSDATSDRLDLAELTLVGNHIFVTSVDADLNLSPTGIINIVSALQLTQDLSVTGQTNLNSTEITGTVDLVSPNILVSGDIEQTGNLSTGNLTVSQNADLSGVELLGNRIYSNSTLTLTAPVGRAVVFNDNLIVDNSVAVGGDLYSPIINVLDQATVSSLYVDDILVQENFVTTTVSNSDLELRAPAPIIYDNLITNGTFDTSFNGWFSEGLSVLEVVDGVARISGGAEGALYQTVAVQPNTDYTISVDMVLAGNDITSSNLFVIGSTFLVNRSLQNTTGTTVTETFNSGSNTSVIVQFQAVNDDLIEFDNVELIEGDQSTYFPPRAIVIPSNNLEITNNLTVITDTDLQSTIITGSLLHTGDRTQTGTVDQTGDLNITGSITSGDADLGNITVTGSTISTSESNSDLELIASGGVGNIVVPNSNVIIENNLTVRTAYVTIPLIFLPENVVTNQYLTQQLRIRDNFIETTESNADLELSTAGTGKVSIGPSLDLTQDLSLTGATNLSDLTVTGSLGVVGNITRTGTTQVNGTVNVDGDLTASLDVNFENIQIVGNTVATSESNSNLELTASGSNVIFDDQVTIEQDLTVSDTLYSQNLTVSNLSVNTVFNDDIQISDNTIATTLSNSNLNLRGNNLGKVRLEKIDISDATITTVDTNQNLIILPYATKILDIDKTNAVKIPSGTTAQKSTGLTGELRFNTTINRFEGWTNNGAITYGGIFSRNRQTSVTALDTNILDFKTANTTRMSVAAAGVTLTGLLADSIRINGNTVSSTSNSDINLAPDGIGEVIMGDIRFDSTNTALLNTALADPMIIQNSGSGYVKFNSTNALVIPVGDTASRPSSPELGDIRFNTDLSAPEIFTGIAYSTLAGESSVATLEEIQELNEIYAILLG